MHYSNKRSVSNTLSQSFHTCPETFSLYSTASAFTSPGGSPIASSCSEGTRFQERLENSFSLCLISIPDSWLHPVTRPSVRMPGPKHESPPEATVTLYITLSDKLVMPSSSKAFLRGFCQRQYVIQSACYIDLYFNGWLGKLFWSSRVLKGVVELVDYHRSGYHQVDWCDQF